MKRKKKKIMKRKIKITKKKKKTKKIKKKMLNARNVSYVAEGGGATRC